MMAPILVGWDRSFLSVAWPIGVQLVFFFLLPELVRYLAPKDLHRRAAYSICESSFLIPHGYHDLCFFHDDSLTSHDDRTTNHCRS